MWKGGGVVFGPKPKQIKLKLNKKEKNLALTTLLVNKYKQTFVFANTDLLAIRDSSSSLPVIKSSPLWGTKQYTQLFKERGIDLNQKTLVILNKDNPKETYETLGMLLNNLPTVEFNAVNKLSVKSLLKADQIIFDSDLLGYLKTMYT